MVNSRFASVLLGVVAASANLVSADDSKGNKLGKNADCTGPDCKACEGLGGIIPYGKTADDILVPECEEIKDVDPKSVPLPYFPKEYTVNVTGSYSSRALARPFDHNYYNLDCVYKYSAEKDAIHFVNTQHINQKDGSFKDNVVEGIHIGATLVTVDKFHILGQEIEACYCLNYTIKGEAVNPVSYDSFIKGSQYIGREKLAVEYMNETRVVDHYQKSFYHFWFDVESNLPVRTLNRQDGDFILSVYHNFVEAVDYKTFDLPKPCSSWWQKPWNKCGPLINRTTTEEVATTETSSKKFLSKSSSTTDSANKKRKTSKLQSMVAQKALPVTMKNEMLYELEKNNEIVRGADCAYYRKVADGMCADSCLPEKLNGLCPRSIIVKYGGLDAGACADLSYTTDMGTDKESAGPCGTLVFEKYSSASAASTSDKETMLYV